MAWARPIRCCRCGRGITKAELPRVIWANSRHMLYLDTAHDVCPDVAAGWAPGVDPWPSPDNADDRADNRFDKSGKKLIDTGGTTL